MKQLELNVMESFRRCKNDIISLQKEIANMSQTQERMMEIIDGLRRGVDRLVIKKPEVRTVVKEVKVPSKPKVIVKRIHSKPKVIVKRVKSKPKVIVKKVHTRPKTIVKTVTKYAKKRYVAAKEGKDFHIPKCPFAQNIKPKSKRTFKSKMAALNKGYKPCKCVK